MLTVPNLLTLSRIFAVPILVFLLWRPSPVDYGSPSCCTASSG
jgi:phosphatidylglycerophosphate synthase